MLVLPSQPSGSEHGDGRTPAQVALVWAMHNPAVAAPILGARTAGQLDDNLGALSVVFEADHLRRLHEVSAVDLGFPRTASVPVSSTSSRVAETAAMRLAQRVASQAWSHSNTTIMIGATAYSAVRPMFPVARCGLQFRPTVAGSMVASNTGFSRGPRPHSNRPTQPLNGRTIVLAGN
jgi:hypothetical protein